MQCPNCGFHNQEGMSFCGKCGNRLGSSEEDTKELSPATLPDDISISAGFVGRQSELTDLTNSLGDALEGRGRIVMLAGEPGMGKTRLAQELASIAERRGATVFWGRCYEEQGAPPYWPWIQPLRTYIHSTDAEQLQVEIGDGASDIAEVITDVRQKLPDLHPSPQLEPEQARFRFFDSITTFLKNSSQNQPLLIVLDDIQWADTSSLRLLEFVASAMGQSRLMILGAYRIEEITRRHPLSRSLGILLREQHFRTIELKGLSQQEVGQIAEATSGRSLEEGLLEKVYDRTEGNPLFVREILSLLDQRDIQDQQDWSISIPAGVKDVIGRRLDRLSEDCNNVLTVASVIGREFDFRLLIALEERLSEDRLLEIIDESLEAQVIEGTSGYERYQFTHALIQQTLVEELSPSRRVRLHARIAEALDNIYASNTESRAAELAHHFFEASPMLGTEKLVQYSLVAGEQAISAYANEEALVHFQRALTAKEGFSSTDVGQGVDAETATILFGLARAQVGTFARSQGQEAIDTLRRAFDAFVDLEDTKNAVAAATHLHGFLPFSSGTADMAARALYMVPPDSLEAGYLLSRYGTALSLERKDYEGAQENLDRAVEIARREGDRVLEVRALAFIGQISWVQGYYRESVGKFLPVIELAQSLDELYTLATSRVWCAGALLAMGDGNVAQIHATAGLGASERLHNSTWLTRGLGENSNLSLLKGEWKAAQEFVARALAELPRDALTLANGALLNLQAGNLEESSEYIKQVIEVVSDSLLGAGLEHAYAAATIPLFARVTGTTELLDVAESSARIILSTPHRANIEISPARVGLALIAIQRGDSESAREQYSILKSRQGTQLSAVICYDRLLGILAQTMSNLDDAQAHFEDALAFCRKAGYRTELAWSLYDYAQFGQAQGEQEKAITLLDESLSISTELRMLPLTEKAIALKEQVESQPTKSPAYPDGLTEREVEVLRLVAQGMTNPEIAEELFISPRTVTTHVSNILNKTNSANRAEAATYASQHGLL